MSGLVALAGTAAHVADASTLLRRGAARGTERVEAWNQQSVSLGVGRFAWEMQPGLSDGILVARDRHVTVVADATLYDRERLGSALRDSGATPRGCSASHLIVAAYLAWGEECVARLQGDFAFALWDTRSRRLIGARSTGGKRPLFVAPLRDGLVAASSISAVLSHPNVPQDLNTVAIAAAACALPSVGGPETAYQAVRRVGAGEIFVWDHRGLRVSSFWAPPAVGGTNARADFASGAQQLRDLLHAAVSDRLGPDLTAVWLSGGWDSSAVWGVGNAVTKASGRGAMHAVSISYPPGDPGREDEFIDQSVRHWRGRVSWLDIASIPMFEDPAADAAHRDEPFAHMFAHWNRSLARASRQAGARVALDGFGGDQLFQASELYLYDLFQTGRWTELWRDWHAREFGGLRRLIARVAKPRLQIGAGPLPWSRYLLRSPAPWIRSDFVSRTDLNERQREFLPPKSIRHFSEGETRYFITSPFYTLVNELVSGIALSEGVESRSPLFDDRVVGFAAGRPRDERASGRETKRLLREAVRGLLPPEILESRPTRTGITSAYAAKWMTGPFSVQAARLLEQDLILEDLQIIDGERFRAAVQPESLANNGNLRVSAFLTWQIELWLRSRETANRGERSTIGEQHRTLHLPVAAGVAGCSEPAARDLLRRPHVREA